MSEVILASAGSGKTTWIVKSALTRLRAREERAAVVSFTIRNAERVREKFAEEAFAPPAGISATTWFTFLLNDLIRPYQNFYSPERISGVNLVGGRSPITKKTSKRYFLDRSNQVYSDKISELAILCEEKSGGRVLRRLAQLYDRVYIDEGQDLAGWDLELVERLLRAPGLRVSLVGDVRQSTYKTNNSAKNSGFSGVRARLLYERWREAGICRVQEHARSYRCSQEICGLADSLFPNQTPAESLSERRSSHEGLFLVRSDDAADYVRHHSARVLVWNTRVKFTAGIPTLNFGDSKGSEFEHVLIVPTKAMREWLTSGETTALTAASTRAKLYVAITRARHSVAFVHDAHSAIPGFRKWDPAGRP